MVRAPSVEQLLDFGRRWDSNPTAEKRGLRSSHRPLWYLEPKWLRWKRESEEKSGARAERRAARKFAKSLIAKSNGSGERSASAPDKAAVTP